MYQNLMIIARKLVLLLTLFCFVVLAITGFYQPLILGEHISGYPVMIHATFAPVFAVCMAVLAVMWAHNCRFCSCDWPWLQKIVRGSTPAKSECGEDRHLGGVMFKLTFWLTMLLALPLILSIMLSMLPWTGSHWQESLLSLHRYVAYAFAIVAIMHVCLLVPACMAGVKSPK